MARDVGGWQLEHGYLGLGAEFAVEMAPQPVAHPALAVLNRPLAQSLGLDPEYLASPQGVAICAGNALPPGSRPLAQAYAGHQFGHLAMLGDGRAILLGEQVDEQGQRWDIQLKGSGRTPFSRGGDGRAALGPMLREYLISEAFAGLRIPTTRSLAVVSSGEAVYRQQGPLPGAVLTRVAASHLRVGTFVYAAGRGDQEALRRLADYTIARHYPQAADAAHPYRSLLDQFIRRQAELIAQWMLVGFIHGVMNTDNMTLSGESIDYGPCAFMDAYDPQTVFSSIDHQGRYAYGNQPSIGQWNVARFAETLLPLLDADSDAALAEANTALAGYAPAYRQAWLSGMRRKLGLLDNEEGDQALADALLTLCAEHQLDWTNTFADLALAIADDQALDQALRPWWKQWQARLWRQGRSADELRQTMAAHNPQLIPRNHLVEEALERAAEDDWQPWDRLLRALQNPFTPLSAADRDLRQPAPAAHAVAYQTFCGT